MLRGKLVLPAPGERPWVHCSWRGHQVPDVPRRGTAPGPRRAWRGEAAFFARKREPRGLALVTPTAVFGDHALSYKPVKTAQVLAGCVGILGQRGECTSRLFHKAAVDSVFFLGGILP